MTAPRAGSAAPLAQLAVVAALALLLQHGWPAIGLPGLVAMACFWPPLVRWAPLPVGRVLAAYLPFAVAWLGFVIVYLRVMHAFGFPVAPQPALLALAEQGMAMPDLVVTVTAIVVLAPLLEELVFRGYLFTALGTVLPAPAVHLLVAVAFGLVHGLPYALPIGVLALLFGWLRARHEALLPPMFAHAVHNGLTVLLTLLWPGHLELLYPR